LAVTFTGRSGATLSGHVWAGKSGPARRPAVVVVNGSVQAPEELYWFAALTLAQQGYVVLTYDPQGQGRSDQTGFGADAREGFPAQTAGTPFYDGPQDALDFLLSTPAKPYLPRKSRGGTSHADKQQRRVASGHDAAHNPLWKLVDATRIGLAGHSFGASGVSWIGQADPRVDAIVGWDNLCAPEACSATGRPSGPPPKITKPALGLSADYGLVAQKKSSMPEPLEKSRGSLAYSKAGVDTGQLNIRGGTHYEFSYIASNAFPATLRGAHLTAWYTLAWFDKYVKGDRSADARLLTQRWRSDAAGAAIDPDKDGNLFSFYYPSRLDITTHGGRRVVCEDLRKGCRGLVKKDGQAAGTFSYLRSTGIEP
jgi:dienelactone hydrolase